MGLIHPTHLSRRRCAVSANDCNDLDQPAQGQNQQASYMGAIEAVQMLGALFRYSFIFRAGNSDHALLDQIIHPSGATHCGRFGCVYIRKDSTINKNLDASSACFHLEKIRTYPT